MSVEKRASFVIVNYNRKDELLITIQKTKDLIQNDLSKYEIIVVDNASTDGSVDAVRKAFPEIDLIINPVNTGAPAFNLGFEKASGKYIIILDDDSHVEEGLEEALLYMDANATLGVLALNVITGPYTKENWKWKDGDSIVGFIGCGAVLRKETYNKVGGYANWMFLYVNEWEYALRCLDAGYKLEFYEKSKVIHRAAKSHRSTKRLRVFVVKHEMGIVYKFFPKSRLRYLVTVAVNNLKCLRNGNIREAWFNILGVFEFLKIRKSLTITPVKPEAQKIFADNFLATKPVFGFLKRMPRALMKQ